MTENGFGLGEGEEGGDGGERGEGEGGEGEEGEEGEGGGEGGERGGGEGEGGGGEDGEEREEGKKEKEKEKEKEKNEKEEKEKEEEEEEKMEKKEKNGKKENSDTEDTTITGRALCALPTTRRVDGSSNKISKKPKQNQLLNPTRRTVGECPIHPPNTRPSPLTHSAMGDRARHKVARVGGPTSAERGDSCTCRGGSRFDILLRTSIPSIDGLPGHSRRSLRFTHRLKPHIRRKTTTPS